MRKGAGPAAGPPVERIVHVYEPFGGGGGRGGARRRAAGPAEGARKRRLVLWGLAALLVLALLGAAAVPGPAGAEGARRKLLLNPLPPIRDALLQRSTEALGNWFLATPFCRDVCTCV